MTGRSSELYDYDEVRASGAATLYVRETTARVIVLGSRQEPNLVVSGEYPVRRRRGGGGAVLMGPGDLWMDFWIPSDDFRYHADVRSAARVVGTWWRDALSAMNDETFVVHEGAAGPALACFAASGDGEVECVSDGANRVKVVGLTQWRVREGSFLSTVLHAHSTSALASLLVGGSVFQHASLESLGLLARGDELRTAVSAAGGPWRHGVAPSLP